MRILFLASAAAIAMAATPAEARNGAWYVGGDFGGMIVDDVDFDLSGSTDGQLGLDYNSGYDGALFVGYDLGAFRLESEVAYKRAQLDSFDTTINLHNSSGYWHPPGTHDARGSASALSFMINGMYDIGDDDGLSGFVGAGAGIARVDFHNSRAAINDGVFLNDSDSAFAWQVFAGVRSPISQNIDVTLRYRFFNVGGADLRTFEDAHDARGGNFRSHSLLGGITFNFGAPPPPPPQ